jgi:hypothetical protein
MIEVGFWALVATDTDNWQKKWLTVNEGCRRRSRNSKKKPQKASPGFLYVP